MDIDHGAAIRDSLALLLTIVVIEALLVFIGFTPVDAAIAITVSGTLANYFGHVAGQRYIPRPDDTESWEVYR